MKNIELRFELGQDVYFMFHNQIEKTQIESVQINIQDKNNGGYNIQPEIKIIYKLKKSRGLKGQELIDFGIKHDDLLFESKEDLIKSL